MTTEQGMPRQLPGTGSPDLAVEGERVGRCENTDLAFQWFGHGVGLPALGRRGGRRESELDLHLYSPSMDRFVQTDLNKSG